ncbi:hypothetical protein [Gramella sp. AN32]|uniref:Uncharacterized protein n=1 Tax=Christiangramia antarctica TaxID=2058158 RepID=A0ABW5X4W3_9FLAO|nr:hypothetical protein [Gramella sp. AN32]
MKFLAFFLIVFSFSEIVAQKEIQMKLESGIENAALQSILMFENITFETLKFEGQLKKRQYQVAIKEYKNGELIGEEILFDGTESEYFRIKTDSLTLQMITKTDHENLYIQLTGNGFSSRKLHYKIFPEKGNYVVKDFLGAIDFKTVPSENSFPIYGIITPTLYKDGSSSYCAVAQSGVPPEKLVEKFDIPHYFLIQMRFL